MRVIILAAAVLIVLPFSSALASLPLRSPLRYWAYKLQTLGPEVGPGILPYADGELEGSYGDAFRGVYGAVGLRSLEGRRRLAGSRSSGGFYLGVDGKAAAEIIDDANREYRAGTAVRLYAALPAGFSVHERMSIWTGSDERPPDFFSPYHVGPEEGRHFYVDWGYLTWQGEWASASMGRIPQRWGPGRFTQLLLSDNSPGLDMIRMWLAPADWLSLTGFTGSVCSDSSVYISAHRLDFFPFRNLRAGLSEAVLYRSQGLEMAYVNPLIPYYLVQWNERDDDNVLLGIDAEWKPSPGIALYGELLVDDFQYQTQYDRPNKMGWTLGADLADGTSGLCGTVEYTRIDRYVYSQRRACNFYLHDDRIIGSALGPDADRATVSAGWAGFWPLLLDARASHRRCGEGTVYEGWPDSVQSGGSFPSGTVESVTEARLGFSWYPWLDMEVHGRGGRRWTDNQDHVPGVSGESWFGSLEAVYNW